MHICCRVAPLSAHRDQRVCRCPPRTVQLHTRSARGLLPACAAVPVHTRSPCMACGPERVARAPASELPRASVYVGRRRHVAGDHAPRAFTFDAHLDAPHRRVPVRPDHGPRARPRVRGCSRFRGSGPCLAASRAPTRAAQRRAALPPPQICTQWPAGAAARAAPAAGRMRTSRRPRRRRRQREHQRQPRATAGASVARVPFRHVHRPAQVSRAARQLQSPAARRSLSNCHRNDGPIHHTAKGAAGQLTRHLRRKLLSLQHGVLARCSPTARPRSAPQAAVQGLSAGDQPRKGRVAHRFRVRDNDRRVLGLLLGRSHAVSVAQTRDARHCPRAVTAAARSVMPFPPASWYLTLNSVCKAPTQGTAWCP